MKSIEIQPTKNSRVLIYERDPADMRFKLKDRATQFRAFPPVFEIRKTGKYPGSRTRRLRVHRFTGNPADRIVCDLTSVKSGIYRGTYGGNPIVLSLSYSAYRETIAEITILLD